MKSKIPLHYQTMMEKIREESLEDEIDVKKVRFILCFKFRVGRTNLTSIISELTKLGLVKYKDHKTLLIL